MTKPQSLELNIPTSCAISKGTPVALPHSAKHSNSSSIHPVPLRDASSGAQQLRQRSLEGANLLIVQGGGPPRRFIYDHLRRRGVNVYIMDEPHTVWKSLAENGDLAGFIPFEVTDPIDVGNRAARVLHQAGLCGFFHGITTYYEDAVSIAAQIAQVQGLAMNPPSVYENARCKYSSRKVMANAGLPVPRFFAINSESDVASACEKVGFPAILKPWCGTGSIGVTRVDCMEEAIASYRTLKLDLDPVKDPLWAQGSQVLLEEFLDGDEFDIDILLCDRCVVHAKVSDNWPCQKPYFAESVMNCPSLLSQEKQDELTQLAVKTVLALGFKMGCVHVEAKYTSKGPRVIEVNGRMGGGPVHLLHSLVWGVDFVEAHCMCALNIAISSRTVAKPMKYCSWMTLQAPYSGTVTRDGWLDFLFDNAIVLDVTYLKNKGDRVVGPEEGMPTWMALITVGCDKNHKLGFQLLRSIVTELAPVPIGTPDGVVTTGFYFPEPPSFFDHC